MQEESMSRLSRMNSWDIPQSCSCCRRWDGGLRGGEGELTS